MNAQDIHQKLVSYVHQRTHALKALIEQYDYQPSPEQVFGIKALVCDLEHFRDTDLHTLCHVITRSSHHLIALLPPDMGKQAHWIKEINDIITFCKEYIKNQNAA